MKDNGLSYKDLFGVEPPTQADRDAEHNKRLYDDVYFAMAGNVYSLARLADAGYIPGSRSTLGDLDRAGKSLLARLTPAQRIADEAATLDALNDIARRSA